MVLKIIIYDEYSPFIHGTFSEEKLNYLHLQDIKTITKAFYTIHLPYFLSTSRLFRGEVNEIIVKKPLYEIVFRLNKVKNNISVSFYNNKGTLFRTESVRIAHNLEKMYLGNYFELTDFEVEFVTGNTCINPINTKYSVK